MENTTLLEISTRPFLYTLSERYSRPITKLVDIPDLVFDEWKEMGFEWIWMMGIWQIGEYGLNIDRTNPKKKSSYDQILPGWTTEDVIGSPYCITSYTLNKELGNEEDILWLRRQLNQRGMKLMLDFVPNHTAFDSVEITKDNKREYYIHFPDNKAPGDFNMPDQIFAQKYGPHQIAYGCASTSWKPSTDSEANEVHLNLKPWIDVAQLNYMNEEMRKSRIEILSKIASQADGIRCDVADIIFNKFFFKKWEFELVNSGYGQLKGEFWAEAISEVKKKFNDCIFLAEASYDYDGSLRKNGFDYVYERLVMNEIDENRPEFDLSVIRRVINDPSVSRYAHMIENHDVKRSLALCSNNQMKEHSAAVIELTLPGMRFVNQDQWCGYKSEICVQLRRAPKEVENSEFVSFYKKLFDVLKLDVLKQGSFSVLDQNCFSENTEILAWSYVLNGTHVVIFVNFTQKRIDVTYKFNGVENVVAEVEDLFADKRITLDKQNELDLHLDTYNYLLIKF